LRKGESEPQIRTRAEQAMRALQEAARVQASARTSLGDVIAIREAALKLDAGMPQRLARAEPLLAEVGAKAEAGDWQESARASHAASLEYWRAGASFLRKVKLAQVREELDALRGRAPSPELEAAEREYRAVSASVQEPLPGKLTDLASRVAEILTMNMAPWYPSDQANPGTKGNMMLLQFGSSGGALKVHVTSGDSGYVLRSMGARSQVSVTARGGRGTDMLTLHYPGGSDARIGLANGRGTSEYDVEFIQATRPSERLHVLTSSRMRIPEGAAVELPVTDEGRALAVISPEATVQYGLELKTVTRDGEQSLKKSRVVQTPSTMQRVQPRNWFDLQKTDVLELVRPVGP
jgi:hypothetical protein